MSLVLDTHIFLWWLNDPRRLSKEQLRALKRTNGEHPVHIADISLWEIATLAAHGRLRTKMPLREWLERALETPHLGVHPITPAVACEIASLGSGFHKDPADRIIVATARVLGVPLVTSDELIIESGAVKVIA